MNLLDLLLAQHVNALSGALQALRQVIARFLLAVGLQLDGVIALLTTGQRLQPAQQVLLGEEKHMRPPLTIALGQCQHAFQRGIVKLVGIIDEQVDLLTGQGQLPHLCQNRAYIRLSDRKPLGYLTQQRIATRHTLGDHHTLHRLLVGAGDQRLAQQGLAATLRTDYRQQQLAVARQMMQLPQNRLALGGEELETGNTRRERVVTELVMRQESFISMQTGHGSLFKS